jgi:uncharacterized protein YdeI (YjbR/CyaY-like superfamily)
MPSRPSASESGTQANELPLLEFPDRDAWVAWLHEHHATAVGVWLKLAKKGSPRPTVTQAQAIETAICFGWIDGQIGTVDQHFYRQRFTHRRSGSKWSRINRDRALELIEGGQMHPTGLAEVHAAQQDGRWEAAYEPQSAIQVPPDFQLALDQAPAAADFFATLTGARRYAFLYRIHDAKRPETRARRIANFTALLAERKTLN